MWIRPRGRLPGTAGLDGAALAFVSDLGLVLVASDELDRADVLPVTVDHTIWFHGPPVFDSWVLLTAKLVQRHGAQALVQGQLSNESGGPIATIVQGVHLLRR